MVRKEAMAMLNDTSPQSGGPEDLLGGDTEARQRFERALRDALWPVLDAVRAEIGRATRQQAERAVQPAQAAMEKQLGLLLEPAERAINDMVASMFDPIAEVLLTRADEALRPLRDDLRDALSDQLRDEMNEALGHLPMDQASAIPPAARAAPPPRAGHHGHSPTQTATQPAHEDSDARSGKVSGGTRPPKVNARGGKAPEKTTSSKKGTGKDARDGEAAEKNAHDGKAAAKGKHLDATHARKASDKKASGTESAAHTGRNAHTEKATDRSRDRASKARSQKRTATGRFARS